MITGDNMETIQHAHVMKAICIFYGLASEAGIEVPVLHACLVLFSTYYRGNTLDV